MVPAFGVDDLARGLLVFVVAQHHVHAAYKNLARNIARVGAVHLRFHIVDGPPARLRHKLAVVAIADKRGALRGAVAHGEGEFDALEEILDFLVQGCSADNDFIGFSAECVIHLLANHLLHLLVHHGHVQQQSHAIILNLREHFLTDDFLHNHGHGNDQRGLNLGIGLRDERGTRQSREEIEVHSVAEGENKLEGKAIRMSHRQDGNHIRARLHMLSELREGEVEVAQQRTVGNHHTLRETRSAARVVDDSQFLGVVLMVADMLLAEIFGVFLAKKLVEMLSGVGDALAARQHERKIRQIDNGFQCGHFIRVDGRGHHVAHEKELCARVVHDVIDLVGREFVQNRHNDGSIGQRGQKSHAPVRAIPAAEGDFVAFFNAAMLENDMQFFYHSRHVVVLQRGALVVG